MDAARRAEIRAYSRRIREEIFDGRNHNIDQPLVPSPPKKEQDYVENFAPTNQRQFISNMPTWKSPSAAPSPRTRRWRGEIASDLVRSRSQSSEENDSTKESTLVTQFSINPTHATTFGLIYHPHSTDPSSQNNKSSVARSPGLSTSFAPIPKNVSYAAQEHKLSKAVWARWLLWVWISQGSKRRCMNNLLQRWKCYAGYCKNRMAKWYFRWNWTHKRQICRYLDAWRSLTWQLRVMQNMIFPISFHRLSLCSIAVFVFKVWAFQIRQFTVCNASQEDQSHDSVSTGKRQTVQGRSLIYNLSHVKRSRKALLHWWDALKDRQKIGKSKVSTVFLLCKSNDNNNFGLTKLPFTTWRSVYSVNRKTRLFTFNNQVYKGQRLLQHATAEWKSVVTDGRLLQSVLRKLSRHHRRRVLQKVFSKWCIRHQECRCLRKFARSLLKTMSLRMLLQSTYSWKVSVVRHIVLKKCHESIAGRLQRQNISLAFDRWLKFKEKSCLLLKMESSAMRKRKILRMWDTFQPWMTLLRRTKTTKNLAIKCRIRLLQPTFDRWRIHALNLRRVRRDIFAIQGKMRACMLSIVLRTWQIIVEGSHLQQKVCRSILLKYGRKLMVGVLATWLDVKRRTVFYERLVCRITKQILRSLLLGYLCHWKMKTSVSFGNRRKVFKTKVGQKLCSRFWMCWLEVALKASKIRSFETRLYRGSFNRSMTYMVKAWVTQLHRNQKKRQIESKIQAKRLLNTIKLAFCSWNWECSSIHKLRVTEMTLQQRRLNRLLMRNFTLWNDILRVSNSVKENVYATRNCGALLVKWRISANLSCGVLRFVKNRKQRDQVALIWENWSQFTLARTAKRDVLCTHCKQLELCKARRHLKLWKEIAGETIPVGCSSALVLQSVSHIMQTIRQAMLSRLWKRWQDLFKFTAQLRGLALSVRQRNKQRCGFDHLRLWQKHCLYQRNLCHVIRDMCGRMRRNIALNAFAAWDRHVYFSLKKQRLCLIGFVHKWNKISLRISRGQCESSAAANYFDLWTMVVEAKQDEQRLLLKDQRLKHHAAIRNHFSKRRLRTSILHWSEMAWRQSRIKSAPEISQRKVDILSVWGCIDRATLSG